MANNKDILSFNLPHGKVSGQGIQDKATRMAIMKLSENISALVKQIKQSEKGK